MQIELCKLKVVGISKPINRMGAPDTTHVSEKMKGNSPFIAIYELANGICVLVKGSRYSA